MLILKGKVTGDIVQIPKINVFSDYTKEFILGNVQKVQSSVCL